MVMHGVLLRKLHMQVVIKQLLQQLQYLAVQGANCACTLCFFDLAFPSRPIRFFRSNLSSLDILIADSSSNDNRF